MIAAALSLLVATTCTSASAGWIEYKLRQMRAEKRRPKPPQSYEERLHRAGYPQEISPLAHPSETPGYDGGYIGGGAPFRGEPRFLQEGVWGWDYPGRLIPARIFLDYWHGLRSQGGTGAYKTDGPHLLH